MERKIVSVAKALVIIMVSPGNPHAVSAFYLVALILLTKVSIFTFCVTFIQIVFDFNILVTPQASSNSCNVYTDNIYFVLSFHPFSVRT